MSLCRVGLTAMRAGGRRLASTNPQVHPGYKATEAIKERLTVEDSKPVFVKGGAGDRVLYGITAAFCLAAVGFNVKLYWDLSLK